jgi:hypothetical protein
MMQDARYRNRDAGCKKQVAGCGILSFGLF